MAEPDVLVIAGNGFNCEQETRYAFEITGGRPEIVHMNDLLSGDVALDDYQITAFVGGFSYGDHLGGGKVAANKFRFQLSDRLKAYISRDRLIMGICNGFQVIVQTGLLPGFDGNYSNHLLTLAPNASARYEDRWVHLLVNEDSPCVFTRNIESLFLPVRHGEGRVFSGDESVMRRVLEMKQGVLFYCGPASMKPTHTYPFNPNGSLHALAGICDPTGRIFGLMPHPEAYLSPYNHPFWTRLKVRNSLPSEGDGVQIFRNAVDYFR